jgi:glycosyltransferase involved in cell wall biosynthesis
VTHRRLGILQLSTFDTFGGAARVAWTLFQGYRRLGHDSWLAVGHRRSDDPDVFALQEVGGLGRIPTAIGRIVDHQLGIETFRFPDSARVLDLPPRRPDLVHAHNLHGEYFDLRLLPALSRRLPLVLTLHDAWLLSGHCAHSLDCERWRIGCGHCPDLTLDPPVRRDATAYNWRRKAAIYHASRLYVATPSQWLMDRVRDSMLAPAIVDAKVIPNGIDTDVFRPGDRSVARDELGLPTHGRILLVAGVATRTNVWKDFPLARAAVQLASERLGESSDGRPTILAVLGDAGEPQRLGSAEVRFIPFVDDPVTVARWYRAADVYVHSARADTYPNSVMEALASGTPVAATNVGGIPEQIDDGQTGLLVPPGDADALSSALIRLLTDDRLRRQMGEAASSSAPRRFGLQRQIDAYEQWYSKLVDDRARHTAGVAGPDER